MNTDKHGLTRIAARERREHKGNEPAGFLCNRLCVCVRSYLWFRKFDSAGFFQFIHVGKHGLAHQPDFFGDWKSPNFLQRFIQPLKRLTIGSVADYRTRNFSVAGHFHDFKGRSRSGLASLFCNSFTMLGTSSEARRKEPGAAGQFFQCRSNGYFSPRLRPGVQTPDHRWDCEHSNSAFFENDS